VVGFPLVVDLYTQSRFNLTISLPLGTYDSNIASLLTGQTDFSITSGPLTAAQAASYPNATVLPILSTAIVPIYRLDGLNSSSPLTLSGSTLALIFAGQITWWNDSLIQADNLGAVFPKQPITVAYQNDSQTFNYVFTEALNKFNSSISSVLPPSRLPSWPTALYAHSQPGLGVQGVVALVLDFDGTIGFCHQQTAQVNDANIANMINRAGQVVSAGTSSVIFTVHELSTQPTALPIHFPSLTDCTTTSCWPIVITSWLLIDTSASPRGCEVREEMVNFWLFYFSATTAAAAVLVNYNIVQTPPVILSALSVTSTLNWVSCNGQPVVPVTPTTVFNLLSPVRLAPLVDPLIDFHAAQFTSAVDFETEPVADAITAMTTGWATNQLTFFYPTEIEEQSVEANVTIAVDYDNFLVVPTFLTSLVWKYNPQISPSVTLNSSVELVLEWEILVAIFTGNLTSWKDPRMVALNPVLGEVLLSNEAAPLGVVFGCLTQTYLALLIDIITNLVAYAEEFNPALLAFLYYQSESATAFMRCDPIFPVRSLDHTCFPSHLSPSTSDVHSFSLSRCTDLVIRVGRDHDRRVSAEFCRQYRVPIGRHRQCERGRVHLHVPTAPRGRLDRDDQALLHARLPPLLRHLDGPRHASADAQARDDSGLLPADQRAVRSGAQAVPGRAEGGRVSVAGAGFVDDQLHHHPPVH